jgi:hypothetical protein
MTTEVKQYSLRQLFWDYDFSEEELQDLLRGNILRVGHLDRTGLYSRLLSSLNWYAILDLVGNDHLDDLLSDAVIGRIHSNDLKRKYATAKRVLFG